LDQKKIEFLNDCFLQAKEKTEAKEKTVCSIIIVDYNSKYFCNETMKQISSIKNLKELRIDCPKINKEDLSALEVLKNINLLSLSVNRLPKQKEAFYVLKKLTKLDSLVVRCLGNTELGFVIGAVGCRLKKIDIHNSGEQELDLKILESCKNLEELCFNNCLICDAKKVLALLEKLTQLKEVGFLYCKKFTKTKEYEDILGYLSTKNIIEIVPNRRNYY
jgi:hypothetical protein